MNQPRPKLHALWWLLACWVAALAMVAAAPASAAEPVALSIRGDHPTYALSGALRFLEDPTRALSITDVTAPRHAERFQPTAAADNDINFGYSSSAYWLALPLQVEPGAPGRWLLEIGYSSLDRVELYTPRANGGYDRQVAGDKLAFATRPYPHRNLVFPVQLAPDTAQTFYLRVESAGNLTIPATLWQPEALHEHDQRNYAVLSLYYGMLLALLLYNLLLFLSTRDYAFLAYVAFAAAMSVGQASMNGFGNQFLWPQWPGWGNVALPVGMAATGFFGTLFTRVFFSTHRTFPRLDAVLLALAAILGFGMLAPALVSYDFAAVFVSFAGMLGSAILTATGVYCLRRGHPGARYYLLAWALLLVGVAVLAMRNLAWLPTNAFTIHAMQIGSALEMLLLSFALADRINVMRGEKDTATRRAIAANDTMVETLRRQEIELESRVAERTRALEKANARLREKERELEHMARHDPLTGLPNRALVSERLAQVVARAHRHGRAAAVLMVDLDGFKAINDRHGHAAGDQLLVRVAERLRRVLRRGDTVARLGGDEFVLIMEDLRAYSETLRVAEKLVTELALPYDLKHGAVHVSASIGVAMFPADGDTPDRLLKNADEAMYAAKSAGRNQWCAYGDIAARTQ